VAEHLFSATEENVGIGSITVECDGLGRPIEGRAGASALEFSLGEHDSDIRGLLITGERPRARGYHILCPTLVVGLLARVEHAFVKWGCTRHGRGWQMSGRGRCG
jgi:hypothetical protein